MENIAAICKVPMIRNGKRMIKIGSTVKITDQIGKPAAPVTMETISITTNARYPTKHILVTCALRGDQEKMKRFTIAGVTNEVYYTALLGYPPTIITSDRVVKAFAENSITLKMSVKYKKEYDRATEQSVLNLLEESDGAKDFSWESKLEEADEIEKSHTAFLLL